jgi:hypothetical protein
MLHRTIFGISGWLICGVIGALIATMKGRSGCFWFLTCAVLGPIGLIVAAVVPSNRS